MARTTTFDTVEGSINLVGTINSDINHEVLVGIP